jgi:protocatechuate 3,4-dioxygenase alpha subunit
LAGGKPQAPHIVVCIFSRDKLRQIYTRLYFSDKAANNADLILTRSSRMAAATPSLPTGRPAGARPSIVSTSSCRARNETGFFDI